jgi:hypothetical protein
MVNNYCFPNVSIEALSKFFLVSSELVYPHLISSHSHSSDLSSTFCNITLPSTGFLLTIFLVVAIINCRIFIGFFSLAVIFIKLLIFAIIYQRFLIVILSFFAVTVVQLLTFTFFFATPSLLASTL